MPLASSRPAQPAQTSNERKIATRVPKSGQGRTLYANMQRSSSGSEDKAHSNVEKQIPGRDRKSALEKAAMRTSRSKTLSSSEKVEEISAPLENEKKNSENATFEKTVAVACNEDDMIETMTTSERAESEAPSEDLTVASRCTKVLEKFLHRNLEIHPENIKKRRKELVEAQEKKINANCPFRPEVSGRAERMQGRGKGIYEVLYKQALEKQEQMVAFQTEMREEMLKKEMKDCTFTPQTNWRSWYSGHARTESDPACENGEQQRETASLRTRESRSNEPISSAKQPTNAQPSYATLWGGAGTFRHSAAPTPQKIRKSLPFSDAGPPQRSSVTYGALEAARKSTSAALSCNSSRPNSRLASRPTDTAHFDTSGASLNYSAEGYAAACTRRSVRKVVGIPSGRNGTKTETTKGSDANELQAFGRHMQERIAVRARQQAKNASVPPTSRTQRVTLKRLRLARNSGTTAPSLEESQSCATSVCFDDHGDKSEDDSFNTRQASGLSKKDWEELTEHLRQRFRNRISENDFNKLRSHFSKQYRELVESSQPRRDGHDDATTNGEFTAAANNFENDSMDFDAAQQSNCVSIYARNKTNGVPVELRDDEIHVDDENYDDGTTTSPVYKDSTDSATTDDASTKASHAWQEAQQRADLDDGRKGIDACETATRNVLQLAHLCMQSDRFHKARKGTDACTDRVLMSSNTGSSKVSRARHDVGIAMGTTINLLSPTSSPKTALRTLQNSMPNPAPNPAMAEAATWWSNQAGSALSRDIDGCNTPPTATEGSWTLMNSTATPTRQSPRLEMNNADSRADGATFTWQKKRHQVKKTSISRGIETPHKSLKSFIHEVNNIRERGTTSVMPAACQQNSILAGAATRIGQSLCDQKPDASVSVGASTPNLQSPRQQMRSHSANINTSSYEWQNHQPHIDRGIVTPLNQSPRSPVNSVDVQTATHEIQRSPCESKRAIVALATENQKQQTICARGANIGARLPASQDVTYMHASPQSQCWVPTCATTSPKRQTALPFDERLPFSWRDCTQVNAVADQFTRGSVYFTQPILPPTPRLPDSPFITAGHAPLISLTNQSENRNSVFSKQQTPKSLSDPSISTSSFERQAFGLLPREHETPSTSSTPQQHPRHVDSTSPGRFKGFVGVAALARQLAVECRKGGERSPIVGAVAGKRSATTSPDESGTLAAAVQS